MELTPKVFRDVQFREKARGGYHPEDVDEFLEQAALGAEVLLERLREATERADRAEKSATEASATDEALKRMLLMGQRTVDQAVKEARDEADRTLADARAQASTLVADAEERGRRAYETQLSESRANMEMAANALRQAQQEVEALRGWVDVNRSHLLGVMRDAQSLIENAGLVSEPPPTRGPEPTGAETAAAELAAAEPIPLPRVADTSAEEVRQSFDNDKAPTGEWDSRLLDEVGREAAQPVPALPTEADEQGQSASGAHSLLAVTSTPGEEASSGQHASADDQTMAFDERALDSFFSEQDIADDRGLGRFRRRQ